MNIVKVLDDYTKTQEQRELVEYLKGILPSTVCYEPIKNKEYLKKYLTPLNDFVIYTTAMPCADAVRVLK